MTARPACTADTSINELLTHLSTEQIDFTIYTQIFTDELYCTLQDLYDDNEWVEFNNHLKFNKFVPTKLIAKLKHIVRHTFHNDIPCTIGAVDVPPVADTHNHTNVNPVRHTRQVSYASSQCKSDLSHGAVEAILHQLSVGSTMTLHISPTIKQSIHLQYINNTIINTETQSRLSSQLMSIGHKFKRRSLSNLLIPLVMKYKVLSTTTLHTNSPHKLLMSRIIVHV